MAAPQPAHPRPVSEVCPTGDLSCAHLDLERGERPVVPAAGQPDIDDQTAQTLDFIAHIADTGTGHTRSLIYAVYRMGHIDAALKAVRDLSGK